MSYQQVLHHGAIAGVTGLCHQLQVDIRCGLLVDCVLFQNAEALLGAGARAGSLAIDFPLAGISALVATHVHVDHVGRIPCLLAVGFKGAILCSEPSIKLLPVVLEDAFQLVFSRDQRQVERYLKSLESRIIALAYDSWFALVGSAQLKAAIRLQRAGHILGSTYVEIGLLYKQSCTSKRIEVSGEFGAPHSPLLSVSKAPERADILMIESTSGDRLHEARRSRRQRQGHVIERALAGNGADSNLQHRPCPGVALRAGRHHHNHPALAGRCAGAQEASAPLSTNLPIVDYLKAMLRDPRHDVLFVGYKAQGTPGRAIQAYGPKGGYVELDDNRYKIGVKISMIGGCSAHAVKLGLVNFVTKMREWPSEIRIVHGDSAAKNTLAAHYQVQYRQANRHVEVKTPGSAGNPGPQVAGR